MTQANQGAAGRWGNRLPVDEVIPALRRALTTGTSAVLQAPPGAGKTTHVPLALVDEPWLAGSKILLLEPRRLAARAVTRRMAQLLGEQAGETVGYRIRRDTRVGPRTRIEVVTEGVLTRMLQSDPALDGVGLLIFDEFHERSVHADLGLALALHSRTLIRPELRILVMSATIDGARVATLLDDAPVITSAGRTYPVEMEYGPRPDIRALPAVVAARVMHALSNDSGDVLVFLPGGAEIRRVAGLLAGRTAKDVSVQQLYGDMSQQAQDVAIRPSQRGARKVVLSTPIAETSLTIDGVGVVIDSGFARAPRFSPRSGMTRLETVRISRSSADQRAGRAGRTGPGRCYRMWPEHEQHHLLEHTSPEILQADLTTVALELAVAGIGDASGLRWLDPPPAATLGHSNALLQMLGALDEAGAATAHGREMAALAAHPRIAHMLLASRAIGASELACDIAAILGERDFVRGTGGPADADIEIRLDLLHPPGTGTTLRNVEVDIPLARRIAAEGAEFKRQLGVHGELRNDDASAGVVLALAYPDRIAQARGDVTDNRFLLRNGRGATLSHPQGLSAARYLVAAELDGDSRSARIFLAAALTRDEIDACLTDQISIEDVIEWNEKSRSVRALSRTRLGAIVLSESLIAGMAPAAATELLLDVVRTEGIASLPWSDESTRIRRRMAFMRAGHPEWPDVSDDALAAGIDDWLRPLLTGRNSFAGIGQELEQALTSMLDWRQRADIDRLAPSHYVAPTGTRVAIDYGDPAAPAIAVRLQEMFGVADTPTVGAGHVPLTVTLLSPARRPVQVTRDLAGFWRGSYFEVRKELRGRYPKHVWPDDPLVAQPTTRARPRGR